MLVYVYWVLGLQLIYYQLSKLGPHLETFQDKFGKHILNTSLPIFLKDIGKLSHWILEIYGTKCRNSQKYEFPSSDSLEI